MKHNSTVLVAEDAEFCDACRVIFGYYGFTVAACARDGREIVAQCAQTEPAFLLTDAQISGMALTDVLHTLRGGDRAPTVIVISGKDSPKTERETLTAGAAYYLVRPVSIQSLAERLAGLIHMKQPAPDVRQAVSEIIRRIGVPAHVRGYRYLRDAVTLVLEDGEMVHHMTKRLYPTVAAMNGATATGVERAMRHAIEVAWTRGDIDVLDEYFGGTVSPAKGKPTNGEFIAGIADRMQYVRT